MANLSNINGKFVVDTAGNIGVGTTDPNFLIEAAGVNSEIALNSTSGSIYRVRSTSSDAFIITKNGVGDRLVIDGSGNSTFSGSVRVTNPTQSNYWLYNAAKTNGFLLGRSLASNDGQDFFIFDTVANSASMTINSSQNATFAGTVTGTTARFDTLNNNANSANIIYRSGTNTIVGNNASALVVQDGGNVGIGTNSPDYLLDLSKTAVAVDTYSGINLQASNYGYTIEGGLTQNVGGELIFSSNNAGTRNPRVKFTANGKVGIGVTDPKNTLNIFSGTDTMMGFWGTSTYSAMQSVNLANTVLKDMRFDFAEAFFIGNAVGIGTDSPSAKLEVVTAVGGDAIRLNFGQSADIFLGFNSANPRILLQDNSNVVTHNFQSNGDNYIVGSNVGIGITSPGAQLDVGGYVQMDSYVANESGNNAFSSGYLKIIAGAKTGWGIGDELGKINFFGNDTSGIGARNAASIVAVCESGNGTSTTTFSSGLSFHTSKYNADAFERMRIDSAGFTTITHSGEGASLTLGQAGSISINENIGYLNFYSNDGSTTSSGGVGGIGVYGETAFNTSYTPTYMSFFTHATTANDGTVEGNVTERMRITSGGTIQVRNGTTIGGEIKLTGTDNDFTINGKRGQVIYEIAGTQTYVMDSQQFYPAADNARNIGTGSNRFSVVYSANGVNTSDRTLKKNIKECDLGIDFIDSLKPKSYNFKDLKEDNDAYGKQRYGLIAQDILETELKDSVFGKKDGEYGLSYNDLIAPMIKAIQELKADNDSLKARIETLENN